MSVFSKRLRELRIEKNLSLRQLALSADISASAVHSYEKDIRVPKREALEALADVLNVDIEYLTGQSNIKNRVAASMGVNSLAEAYAQRKSTIYPLDIQLFAEENSPTALSLTEGERKLLEVYRKASDDVKPVLVKAMESLESMPLDKLMLVAELFGK